MAVVESCLDLLVCIRLCQGPGGRHFVGWLVCCALRGLFYEPVPVGCGVVGPSRVVIGCHVGALRGSFVRFCASKFATRGSNEGT